jgi:hypothetical protein
LLILGGYIKLKTQAGWRAVGGIFELERKLFKESRYPYVWVMRVCCFAFEKPYDGPRSRIS